MGLSASPKLVQALVRALAGLARRGPRLLGARREVRDAPQLPALRAQLLYLLDRARAPP